MKAVLKRNPGLGLEVSEVPKPSPGRKEVLIRVKNAAICGSDMDLYRFAPAYETVKLPVIMGHEFSGEVVQKGMNVGDVEVGERVVSEAIVWCGRCSLCRIERTNICENRRSTASVFIRERSSISRSTGCACRAVPRQHAKSCATEAR